MRPLMHKLRIINLVPLDGDLNYSTRDAAKLESLIKNVKNFVFTCKIQMAFNDSLFADNFEAKNSKNIVKFRLKAAHLKLGLSEVDEDVGTKLKMLFGSDTEVTKKSPKIDNEIIRKEYGMQKVAIEIWKELKSGKSYSVVFAHYISPYSFFVVIESSENFVLKEWMKKIKDFSDLQHLDNPIIGSSCLVALNGINKRAKVLAVSENQVELLLVDFGEIVNEEKTSLFEIPDELKEFRYQAVHCSLKGIKPKFNMNFWPSMQKSVIRKLFNDREWSMKVLENNQKSHEFNYLGINSYEVLLFDDSEYLHEIAIEKFYANPDENFEIQNESSDEDSTESYDTETQSETFEKTESGYRSSESEQNTEDVPSFNEEGLKTLMELYQKSIDEEYKPEVKSVPKKSESQQEIKPSLLTNLFKHPYIEWRQNEIYLYLIVTAKDCIDYAIVLDECTADISIVYAEKKTERAVLQLYGLITPKLCSHNHSGGSIILRLAKRTINREWPRLTQDKSYSTYIKFSDEDVPYIPTESISKMSMAVNGRPAGLSDDESDFESTTNAEYFSSEEDN